MKTPLVAVLFGALLAFSACQSNSVSPANNPNVNPNATPSGGIVPGQTNNSG